MQKIELTSNRLLLVPFKPEQVTEDYLDWITDEELTTYIEKENPNLTLDDLRIFVEDLDQSKNDIFYRIIYKDNNLHIGNIRLGPIDFVNSTTGFGILMGRREYHKQGLAEEAINLIKNFAFNKLKLSQFQFVCFADNFGAMSLYKKMGFTKKEFNKKMKKDEITYDQVLWYENNPKEIK